MEPLKEFAARYHLRLWRDACGDPFVTGRFGHLYAHGGGRLGMVLEDRATGPGRARALLLRRRAALAAGFAPHQLGDAESILLFDPENQAHAQLGIRLVGARPKRRASPAQLAALRAARESRQNGSNHCAEAVPAA
jgi:hypothetical protein